jgi:GTP-binding protein
MKILKAEFARGIIGGDYSTNDNLPQIAFLGRSNSGKSSVIGSLTGKKDLVRTSKTPGATIEANFFRINDAFYLVDFPGYGFAKRSVAARNRMIKRIFWYLESSNVKPKVIFLIIDGEVGITKLDWEMIRHINENKHNIIIIANKIDKVAPTKRANRVLSLIEESKGMQILGYSAKTQEGKEELFKKIESYL